METICFKDSLFTALFLVLLGPKETRVQAGADLHKRPVQNRRNGNELKEILGEELYSQVTDKLGR